jgi:hypothetical protein
MINRTGHFTHHRSTASVAGSKEGHYPKIPDLCAHSESLVAVGSPHDRKQSLSVARRPRRLSQRLSSTSTTVPLTRVTVPWSFSS